MACTVTPFSVRFAIPSDGSQISGGTQEDPICGNVGYKWPACRPATNAPVAAVANTSPTDDRANAFGYAYVMFGLMTRSAVSRVIE